jgi:hypothetical protein
MNMLHHCEDPIGLLQSLGGLLMDGGQLYLTSLVRNGRLVGDAYLTLLHKQGWIVQPRSRIELESLLEEGLNRRTEMWIRGNMAYATTASRGATD